MQLKVFSCKTTSIPRNAQDDNATAIRQLRELVQSLQKKLENREKEYDEFKCPLIDLECDFEELKEKYDEIKVENEGLKLENGRLQLENDEFREAIQLRISSDSSPDIDVFGENHPICFKCYTHDKEALTQFDFTQTNTTTTSGNETRHLVDEDRTDNRQTTEAVE